MTEIEQVKGGVPWENSNNADQMMMMENEDDWEGGNNSAKLFERSRIKALAGENIINYKLSVHKTHAVSWSTIWIYGLAIK